MYMAKEPSSLFALARRLAIIPKREKDKEGSDKEPRKEDKLQGSVSEAELSTDWKRNNPRACWNLHRSAKIRV